MALSIGVLAEDQITVGESVVRVKHFADPDTIVIEVITEGGVSEFVITKKSRIQILPDVFVFVGQGPNNTTNRLAFEAPRNIPIHRVPRPGRHAHRG